MYNEKLKQRYLSERIKSNSEQYYNNLIYRFDIIASEEERLDTDLCNFSVEEILNAYKARNTSSVEYLMVSNFIYASYTDFCIYNGLVKDSQNHYRDISIELLNECINKLWLNKSILTKEEIYQIVDELENPCDKFIILGIFEGICGDSYEDLFHAEMSQFDGNVMHCHSGVDVVVSDKLIGIAADSANEYTYYCLTNSDNQALSYRYFNRNDHHIIKMSVKKSAKSLDEADQALMVRRIQKRIDKIRNYFNILGIRGKSILYSGLIDFINTKHAEQPEKSIRDIIVENMTYIEAVYKTMVGKIDMFITRYKDFLK